MSENKSSKAFLIAAPGSNSGKTVVTLGLIAALKRKGLKVQPFKCGPDYIDPLHHSVVAESPSYNLDTWMSDKTHVKAVFNHKASQADISVVEGVMGLFDGADKDKGSAADVARMLDIPVLLVVDAKAMAYSAAPLLYGYANFDSRVKIAGVIFNRVAGESHYAFLKKAAIDAGVKPLGFLPRDNRLAIESRHLGLHLPDSDNKQIVTVAADLLEQYVDLEELTKRFVLKIAIEPPTSCRYRNLRIAVAKDEAFCFSYQANLDRLKEIGDITFFSPLNDKILPEVDLIWLPGGYPELHLKQLSENKAMQEQIRLYAEEGRAIIAECGGMMYLGQSLEDNSGNSYSMAGVLDCITTLSDMKLNLGYRRLQVDGTDFFAHEFHYSNFIEKGVNCAEISVVSAREREVDMPVLRYKNVWASYAHLYLGEAEKMETFLSELAL